MGVAVAKKRYNLFLPEELYEEVRVQAEKRDTTAVELFRRILKLGLLALQVEDDPNAEFIIREGDKETKVVMF